MRLNPCSWLRQLRRSACFAGWGGKGAGDEDGGAFADFAYSARGEAESVWTDLTNDSGSEAGAAIEAVCRHVVESIDERWIVSEKT